MLGVDRERDGRRQGALERAKWLLAEAGGDLGPVEEGVHRDGQVVGDLGDEEVVGERDALLVDLAAADDVDALERERVAVQREVLDGGVERVGPDHVVWTGGGGGTWGGGLCWEAMRDHDVESARQGPESGRDGLPGLSAHDDCVLQAGVERGGGQLAEVLHLLGEPPGQRALEADAVLGHETRHDTAYGHLLRASHWAGACGECCARASTRVKRLIELFNLEKFRIERGGGQNSCKGRGASTTASTTASTNTHHELHVHQRVGLLRRHYHVHQMHRSAADGRCQGQENSHLSLHLHGLRALAAGGGCARGLLAGLLLRHPVPDLHAYRRGTGAGGVHLRLGRMQKRHNAGPAAQGRAHSGAQVQETLLRAARLAF